MGRERKLTWCHPTSGRSRIRSAASFAVQRAAAILNADVTPRPYPAVIRLARTRYLPDHLPASSLAGFHRAARLSAKGAPLYSSIHWQTLFPSIYRIRSPDVKASSPVRDHTRLDGTDGILRSAAPRAMLPSPRHAVRSLPAHKPSKSDRNGRSAALRARSLSGTNGSAPSRLS